MCKSHEIFLQFWTTYLLGLHIHERLFSWYQIPSKTTPHRYNRDLQLARLGEEAETYQAWLHRTYALHGLVLVSELRTQPFPIIITQLLTPSSFWNYNTLIIIATLVQDVIQCTRRRWWAFILVICSYFSDLIASGGALCHTWLYIFIFYKFKLCYKLRSSEG